MKLITSIDEIQQTISRHRLENKRIAFVPTMGFLHEGHASLLREGRRQGDILVLSIFVNPIQFGKNEDLDRYPRDLARDSRIAEECGVDIIFTPDAAEMYPAGFQTSISVQELSQPLCGASRPGHFDGVATVVAKLFNIVRPDLALFGRKDYQQLALIRQMTSDLSMPVTVQGMPIVRERDGLAMSSRNAYLSTVERQSALCLHRAISAVRAAYASGEQSIDRLREEALAIIHNEQAVQIDYLEFRDGTTLQPATIAVDGTLLALAVNLGKTRLIDNTLLGKEL